MTSILQNLNVIVELYGGKIIKVDDYKITAKFVNADDKHNCREHLSKLEGRRIRTIPCNWGIGLHLSMELV